MNPGGQSAVRTSVAERLNRLPRHGVRLSHDVPTNAKLLIRAVT